MFESEREWRRAIEQTWVARFPKQSLATFGSTNISYYVVTEPVYLDEEPEKPEGVVRTGRVTAERPAIVTPTYAMNIQGFSSEAYEYFQSVAMQAGPNSPGLLYKYKNETGNTEIVSGAASDIANRISGNLERKKEDMAVVMVGVDQLWDVALLKFIYEFTSSSLVGNIQDLKGKGLLEPQESLGGVPMAAVEQINRLFREVDQGANPEILKRELDRWGLFDFYQDRFLDLFQRR